MECYKGRFGYRVIRKSLRCIELRAVRELGSNYINSNYYRFHIVFIHGLLSRIQLKQILSAILQRLKGRDGRKGNTYHSGIARAHRQW
jgi:hypothetical protein